MDSLDDPQSYSDEEKYYRPRNVSVTGGALKISALHESYGGKSYTSGKLVSDSKFSFAYGKVEARMKLPVGTGCWPALVVAARRLQRFMTTKW